MRNAFAVLLLIACGEEEEVRQPPPHAARAHAQERRCGAEAAYEGGEFLETDDGARIYYRVAGPADAPALLVLHGGPGLNTYPFERTAGPLLERSLRMVYVDQRGAGRSAGGRDGYRLGMDPTIGDLERLREHLGIARWSLAGHSFGGTVAMAYVTRHPDAIEKLVMIEATPDLDTALENQVRALGQADPNVAAIAADGRPAMDRLFDIYQTLGRMETQRRVHWASDEGHRAGERWDRESRLGDCTRDGLLASYTQAGWTSSHPELMRPLGKPTLAIAGRQSRVLGEELATRTATAWDAELVWMEHSGHFPFVEEPEPFAAAVIAFVRPE